MINYKAHGKSFNTESWRYYRFDGKLYYYRKQMIDGKWAAIKVTERDLENGSYLYMFEHGLTR